MKTLRILLGLWLTASGASAAVTLSQTFDYSSQANGGYTIEAGNPVGLAVQGNFNLAQAGAHLVALSIGLNIAGGYDGDYYAYLKSPYGTTVVLLNQPGSDIFGAPATGYGNGGVNSFVLSSTAAVNIQGVDGTFGTALTGMFGAAGDLGAFGTGARPGGATDGAWTLYIDDLGSGGGSGTLQSWTLNETVIAAPEPPYVVAGLMLFAAGVARARAKRSGQAPF